MRDIDQWPESLIDQVEFERLIGQFLRTHVEGNEILTRWMASLPAECSESDRWPGSILDRAALKRDIGRFLRTHRDGDTRLLDFLASVPPDRSEQEYRRQRAAASLHLSHTE